MLLINPSFGATDEEIDEAKKTPSGVLYVKVIEAKELIAKSLVGNKSSMLWRLLITNVPGACVKLVCGDGRKQGTSVISDQFVA